MIEIQTQLHEQCPICKQRFGLFFLPHGDEAVEKAKEYKVFQILRSLFYGVTKPRSVAQLNTYWACCTFVAQSADDPKINTKEKVDFMCRVELNFVDPNVIYVKLDGTVVRGYRSIALKNLRHIEATKYFDGAFGLMADILGVTPEKLIENVKANMRYR